MSIAIIWLVSISISTYAYIMLMRERLYIKTMFTLAFICTMVNMLLREQHYIKTMFTLAFICTMVSMLLREQLNIKKRCTWHHLDWTRDLQIFSLTLSQLSYPHNIWNDFVQLLTLTRTIVSIVDLLFYLDEWFVL